MKFLERKSNLRNLYFWNQNIWAQSYLLQLQHLVASIGGPLSLGFHPLGVVMVISWQRKSGINKIISFYWTWNSKPTDFSPTDFDISLVWCSLTPSRHCFVLSKSVTMWWRGYGHLFDCNVINKCPAQTPLWSQPLLLIIQGQQTSLLSHHRPRSCKLFDNNCVWPAGVDTSGLRRQRYSPVISALGIPINVLQHHTILFWEYMRIVKPVSR